MSITKLTTKDWQALAATSTTDNDLPDGWEASSITVADEQVAYCISSSTQPDRQVYLTASGALGITAAGDGCWAPARAVAHVLSRADVDSTKAALVLPRGMSAAEAQALLDVAAEAVGYVMVDMILEKTRAMFGIDEPSHRRCTSGCGWAWTGTSTEPCPKCGAERASDEPGGESP